MEKIMDWLLEYFMMPVIVIFTVLGTLGLLAFGIVAFVHWIGEPKEEAVTLKAAEWACTASEIRRQPDYRCGGKISRTCEGYTYKACTQWSARMDAK